MTADDVCTDRCYGSSRQYNRLLQPANVSHFLPCQSTLQSADAVSYRIFIRVILSGSIEAIFSSHDEVVLRAIK